VVKPGKKWDHRCHHASEPISSFYSVSITKDTLKYNGKIYNKVECSIGVDCDSIWVRENEKKVWFLKMGKSIFQGQEILMYDFNLEKGDTFRFKSPSKNSTDSFRIAMIVVSKTFVLEERKYTEFNRQIFYENSSDHEFFPAPYWAEGIGLTIGPYPLYYGYYASFFSEMICGMCVFDGQKQIFPSTGICDSTIRISANEKSFFELYPNPAQKQFTIQMDSYEKIHIQIYNTLGQKIDEFTLKDKLNYSIPCNYIKGIYLVRVFNGKSEYQSNLIIE